MGRAGCRASERRDNVGFPSRRDVGIEVDDVRTERCTRVQRDPGHGAVHSVHHRHFDGVSGSGRRSDTSNTEVFEGNVISGCQGKGGPEEEPRRQELATGAMGEEARIHGLLTWGLKGHFLI